MGTVVDINVKCASSSAACGPFATSDINASNVFQSASTVGFTDNITGNAPTEATLGFYGLGDGAGSGALSTRPVITTSSTSSVGSKLNLIGMTAGPTTGVQGTTGTLVQMATGPAPSGDLVKFDLNGNAVDSALLAANVANTVTFFTNASGTGTASAIAPSSAITLWGFSLPNAVNTSQVTFWVTTHDAVGTNQYNLGIYDSSGNKKVEVGATPASTLLGSVNNAARTASWTSSTTLPPGKYYFATVTGCGGSCASLGGSPNGTFAQNATTTTTTSGATLPTPIVTPSDTWTVGAVPLITIH